MLKDITLGQYFPGNTLLHRLDPRTKLVAVIGYIVALFLAKWFISYGLMFVFLTSCIAVSRIRLKTMLRGLKPLVIVILLTALLNVLYTGGEHVIAEFWVFTISREGVRTAFFMVIRIIMLVMGTFLLTYTTSPIALTDGIESLLGRAKALVPVLVPLFISAFRRADELATAMECRCYHGGEGRTRMKQLRYGKADAAAYLTCAALIAAVVTLRRFGL